ncbi:MAG TPA: nucleotide sugar dehydrogenase [Candidatus Baltobacteraceae bacterium]|nr:nucleotide sugar dehydrogenase [Candidatus Baltobacteraceae bacterium]
MENVLARPFSARDLLLERIKSKQARIGVLGLGYVGLPLAVAFARAGFDTTGFEVDERKARLLSEGTSYVEDVPDADIREQLAAQRFHAASTADDLRNCDCILVCVPTPLSKSHDPDLSYIRHATAAICRTLRQGQLVVFESTTYPGCTDELVLPELLRTGLELDKDFLLAFSPERVDPGNARFHTENIARIVGGSSDDSCSAATALYGQIVQHVYPVSSTRVAETAKLLENTFRAVNIGLVNELAMMCRQMNIDVWEVIDAAKTKPYGFMPFYPGPGVGGHCIPLDPAYLAWRGRQFNFESHFINVAQQVNAAMPQHVVRLIADALNEDGKALKNARVLLLGVAYKKNVSDVRESPALEIIQGLRAKKARVQFYDPLIAAIDFDKAHSRDEVTQFGGDRRRRLHLRYEEHDGERSRRLSDTLHGSRLTDTLLAESDCVVIVTDHDSLDYRAVTQHAKLVVDTRRAIPPALRASSHARVVTL